MSVWTIIYHHQITRLGSNFFHVDLFFTSIFSFDFSNNIWSSFRKFRLLFWIKRFIVTYIMFSIAIFIDIVIDLKIIWRFEFISSLIFLIFFVCSVIFANCLLFWSFFFIFWKWISIFWFWSCKPILLNMWDFIFTFAFTHVLSSFNTLSFWWKFDDFFQILIIVFYSFDNCMGFLINLWNLLLRFLVILSFFLFDYFWIE